MAYDGTCLHCGAAFTGRKRTWCYACLPADDGSMAYRRRSAHLHNFKQTGEHVQCCGLRRCAGCSRTFARWCTWEKPPGVALQRCHGCYLKHTRSRQTARPLYGPPAPPRRGTRPQGKAWDELTQRVYAEETHCGFCGLIVDQSLPHTHRMSRTIDHIEPLGLGGAPWDRSNLRLAHRSCNAKGGHVWAQKAQLVRAAMWIGLRLTA